MSSPSQVRAISNSQSNQRKPNPYKIHPLPHFQFLNLSHQSPHSTQTMLPKLTTTILLSLSLLTSLTLSAPTATPPPQALSKRASSASYTLGQLDTFASNTPFLSFDNGVTFNLIPSNSAFAAIQNNAVVWWDNVNFTPGCSSGAYLCRLLFQDDSNLVSYVNGAVKWNSGTSGKGYKLVFNSVMPFIQTFSAAGKVVWTTPVSGSSQPPAPGCVHPPCAAPQ